MGQPKHESDGDKEKLFSPPLKWAGGKRWLVPKLAQYFSRDNSLRLVEPFVGGMAVALGLNPKRALLADINPHLINFYQWLQRGLAIDIELKNDSVVYYRNRLRFNKLVAANEAHTAEAAALFYYLNRTGFNGLCRFNSSGLFNVPFGRYSTINYTGDFSHLREVLSSWEFVCGDFSELRIGRGDFLYVDPPYDVEFTRYAQTDFDWDAQLRLAQWLAQLSNPMIVSNQGTERILKLYESCGFKIELVTAPRRIASNGDRTPACEMLAFKNIQTL